jgi:hypothetical protein
LAAAGGHQVRVDQTVQVADANAAPKGSFHLRLPVDLRQLPTEVAENAKAPVWAGAFSGPKGDTNERF